MSSQILYYIQATPLGLLRLAASSAGLVEAKFLESANKAEVELPSISGRRFLYSKYRRETHKDLDAGHFIEEARRALENYFRGEEDALLRVKIAPQGTEFQKAVWSSLRDVPFGSTLTYSELAQASGRPSAVRAAGTACKRNPLILFIPCHRIIGKDRSLTGFAGGIERKAFLLQHEGQRVLNEHPVPSERSVALQA